MDINSLPFVRSSSTVRLSDGNKPTPVVVQSSSHTSGSSGAHNFTTSSAQSGGYLKTTVHRQQRFGHYDIKLSFPEPSSGDFGSLRDLPNPSNLRRRGRASESGSQRQKRKRENRPDVFDHLAQLRRKQHRFEMESVPHEAQEVPASPLLLRDVQDTVDLNLSFHGKTPMKSTSKAYSYDISNSGLSSTGETANFPPLSDTSSQTQFHHARVTKSNAWAYSSETLAHQPVDESLDFDQFSSDSVVDRTGQDVFLLQPERSQQGTSISDHLVRYNGELDTSFSVPSLDQEDAEDFDDHEVPAWTHAISLPHLPPNPPPPRR